MMNVMSDPAIAGTSRGWTLLSASLRRIAEAWAVESDERKTAKGIRQLAAFTDRELSDIGLGRSDLTPEGLATAGVRRAGFQAAVAAEIGRRG